jgi:hypothetical protein
MRERAKEGASLGEEKGWEFVLTKVWKGNSMRLVDFYLKEKSMKVRDSINKKLTSLSLRVSVDKCHKFGVDLNFNSIKIKRRCQ